MIEGGRPKPLLGKQVLSSELEENNFCIGWKPVPPAVAPYESRVTDRS